MNTSQAGGMYQEIGSLTRQLHDSLNQVGHISLLQQAADQIPDARSRLSHIAELTGAAAERSLNAVDAARGEQERQIESLTNLLRELQGRTPNVIATDRAVQVLTALRDGCERTNAQLTEIMMAQDFHDLTTQIVQRIVIVATGVEERLLRLLLEAAPAADASAPVSAVRAGQNATTDISAGIGTGNGAGASGAGHELLGPVKAGTRPDVVNDQAQVDDLLASLGF